MDDQETSQLSQVSDESKSAKDRLTDLTENAFQDLNVCMVDLEIEAIEERPQAYGKAYKNTVRARRAATGGPSMNRLQRRLQERTRYQDNTESDESLKSSQNELGRGCNSRHLK